MLLRHLLEQGLSKTAIARETGVSRGLVYHILRTGALERDLTAARPPRTRQRVPRRLDPFTPIIDARLGTFPALSAVRLLAECRAAGRTGGYSQLRDYVRRARPGLIAEPVVRVATAPGHQAQVDFAEFRVAWGMRQALLVVLGYSRLLWVAFYPRQTMQVLIHGLEGAFTAFGGVPHELLFDPLEPVVIADERPGGGRLLENPESLRFAAHWRSSGALGSGRVARIAPRPSGKSSARCAISASAWSTGASFWVTPISPPSVGTGSGTWPMRVHATTKAIRPRRSPGSASPRRSRPSSGRSPRDPIGRWCRCLCPRRGSSRPTHAAHSVRRAQLADLKMPGALEAVDGILQQVDGGQLAAPAALVALLDAQITLRNSRRLATAMRSSRLPAIKRLSEFDFPIRLHLPALAQTRAGGESAHPGLLGGLSDRREIVFLLGPPGVAKTHLALSLAVATVESGRGVYYATPAELITSREEACQAGHLAQRIRTLTFPSLMVIDEVGSLPISRTGAMLFFQVISRRYEHASTVLTSNKSFEEWGEIFGDEVMAAAVIDRLLHHCHIVNIRGNSYRLRQHADLRAALRRQPAQRATAMKAHPTPKRKEAPAP